MSSNVSDNDSGSKSAKQTLGGYELLGKIGQGAMGAVFMARQTSMDRVVALKVLPQRLAKNKDFVARFLREARSAGKLNQPSIVQAFDAGEADGYYYIAMEYIDGPGLDDLLETDGALSEQRALEIVRDIARALGYAHRAGLIHRDVKPANILLTTEGEAKLADLGLARESIVDGDSSLTNVGVALGTPDYMAPEQVRGDGDIDGRCDIYALGATLYHLLIGRPPFKGGTRAEVMSKHLTEQAPNPRKANPQISLAAMTIIKKAMSKEPDARYADASEMLAAIEAAIEGESAAVAGSDTGRGTALSRARERKNQPINKKWLYAGGAAAAVVVLGALIAVFTGPKDRTRASQPTENPSKTVQKPAVTPKKTAAETDAERLAAVRKWARNHPGEYDAAIRSYRNVVAQLTTPALKNEAEAELQALKRKRAAAMKEAKAALASARSRAAALAKAGDYDGAIAVFNNLPERFSYVLGNSANEEAAQLRDEADAKVQAALDEAARLGAAGKFPEALARLKQLEPLRYEPTSKEINQRRAHLRTEQERLAKTEQQRIIAAALARVGALLDQVDAAARDNPARAKELAKAALKDPALKPAGNALTTAARVGILVGTLGERRHNALVECLKKKLVGQRVIIETKHGKKGGKVKSVSGTQIVLDKSFKIGDTVKERPDEIVLIADLTGNTLKKYCPKLEPKTPDESVACAVLAMARGDAAVMAAALDACKQHPLHGRYAGKLQAIRPAVPDPEKPTDVASSPEKTDQVDKPQLPDEAERRAFRSKARAALSQVQRFLRALKTDGLSWTSRKRMVYEAGILQKQAVAVEFLGRAGDGKACVAAFIQYRKLTERIGKVDEDTYVPYDTSASRNELLRRAKDSVIVAADALCRYSQPEHAMAIVSAGPQRGFSTHVYALLAGVYDQAWQQGKKEEHLKLALKYYGNYRLSSSAGAWLANFRCRQLKALSEGTAAPRLAPPTKSKRDISYSRSRAEDGVPGTKKAAARGLAKFRTAMRDPETSGPHNSDLGYLARPFGSWAIMEAATGDTRKTFAALAQHRECLSTYYNAHTKKPCENCRREIEQIKISLSFEVAPQLIRTKQYDGAVRVLKQVTLKNIQQYSKHPLTHVLQLAESYDQAWLGARRTDCKRAAERCYKILVRGGRANYVIRARIKELADAKIPAGPATQ